MKIRMSFLWVLLAAMTLAAQTTTSSSSSSSSSSYDSRSAPASQAATKKDADERIRPQAATSPNAQAQPPQQPPQPPPTLASVVDRQVSNYEKLIVGVAEAMPEDKYNFTPASLNIPGAAFKDLR